MDYRPITDKVISDSIVYIEKRKLTQAAEVDVPTFSYRVFYSMLCEIARWRAIGKCSCSATTNIGDVVEFGFGNLDDNGYWEFPCTHGNKPYPVPEY